MTGKKDHFVPQGYLRQFAIDIDRQNKDREKWRVHELNKQKPQLPSPTAKINSIAYGKRFERYPNDVSFEETLRKKISGLENHFFRIQNKLVETENIHKLTNGELGQLILYIAFQRERTLARRRLIGESAASLVNEYDKSGNIDEIIDFEARAQEIIFDTQKSFEKR
ncbi:MAG: DUF4238 domain-containing protein, partial [Deinococcota bacterium]